MRTLASIQKIINIEPIENADAIEVATVLGWKVVVRKNIHKIGELIIYFEVDSLLPEHPAFEFLRTSSWNEKLKAYRLRTIKLRGQVSQGLIVPLNTFDIKEAKEGLDVTDIIGVSKYEPPIPAEISGEAKPFSWPIVKTDETRIQSIPEIIKKLNGKPYYISCKLDGTSSSFIYDSEKEYNVCGHNYSFKEKEDNTFWKLSKKYSIKEVLEDFYNRKGIHIALQGEVCGPDIQDNKLGLKEHDVFFFNMVNVDTRTVCSYDDLICFCAEYGLKTVPILEAGDNFQYSSIEELLKRAEGFYRNDGFENALPKQRREGIVVRSKDSSISFKVISNTFLLDKDNDK